MGHPPPLHSPHLRSPAVFVFQVPPIEEGFDDPKHSLKPWDAKKVGAGWGGVTQCGFFGGGGNSKASNASHAWLLLLPVPAALQHGHQRLPDGKGGEGGVGRGGCGVGGAQGQPLRPLFIAVLSFGSSIPPRPDRGPARSPASSEGGEQWGGEGGSEGRRRLGGSGEQWGQPEVGGAVKE